LRVVKNNK